MVQQKAAANVQVEAPEIEAEEGAGPADLVAALEESMRRVKKGMRQVKRKTGED